MLRKLTEKFSAIKKIHWPKSSYGNNSFIRNIKDLRNMSYHFV